MYVLPKKNFFSDERRGRVTHALGVVSGLVQNGFQTHVMSGDGLRSFREDLGPEANIIEHGSGTWVTWHFKLLEKIRKILKANRNIRYVVIRYAASNFFLFTSLAADFPEVKWGFEVNSLAYHRLIRMPLGPGRLVLGIERFFLGRMGFLYVVSNALKKDIGRNDPKILDKIIVIPNGGPRQRAVAVKKEIAGDNPIHFFYLGMFQPYYEFKLTIDAFKKFIAGGSPGELHFFGTGPLVNHATEYAACHRNIHFHGRYVLQDLITKNWFGRNCALVLPYKGKGDRHIHSPIKLFEYMALGRPIIASDIGQTKEILVDGYSAVFYQSGNCESLCAGMKRLAGDPGLQMRLAKNLQHTYKDKHTWFARMYAFTQQLEKRFE